MRLFLKTEVKRQAGEDLSVNEIVEKYTGFLGPLLFVSSTRTFGQVLTVARAAAVFHRIAVKAPTPQATERHFKNC